MKINKILAAGVAATLAVSALSAVASAEVKSIEFPMDYTQTNVKWNDTKIQWLGDNDYIGGAGYGAADTARALLTALEADTDVLKTFGAALADLGGTDGKLAILGTTGGMPVIDVDDGAKTEGTDAIGLFIKGATLPTSLASHEAKVAALIDQILAQGPTVAAADAKTEDVYEAKKLVGDWKSLKAKLEALDEQLIAIYDIIKNNADAGTAPAAVLTEIGVLEDTIDAMSAGIRNAEDALIGAPLLEDKERGGIWIDTKTPVLTTAGKYVKITGAKITIKGTKRGSTASETWSGNFVDAYKAFKDHLGDGDANKDGLYLVFGPRYVNRPGYVNLNVFGTITDVELDINFDLTDKDGNLLVFLNEKDYNANKEIAAKALKDAAATKIWYLDQFNIDLDNTDVYTPNVATDAAKNWINSWVRSDNYTALPDSTTNLFKMYRALVNSVVTGNVADNSNSKVTKYAFVYKTQENGKTIERKDVHVMSLTHDNASQNQVGKFDGNQTYYDSGLGTNPNEFGGLASQVADFFNKQNNGQIEFHFIDPAKVTTWTSNGIPSTEVGLRTALAQTAFALFFNYEESTGSIQTIGTVDKDALTVTFDMEDVLSDFGGLTKANLHSIYYGCNNGLDYGDPYKNTGFAVDKVTLRYDDAPAAVDAQTADDDADDDAAVVVADDDDDDVVADDDDDDIAADDDIIEDDDDDDDDAGEIIADDDDDDDDVNNDVDYVDADDDANPGTGVGLAVIPAIVAGAALVVSKKRK